MVSWNNLDTLASFKELEATERVNLAEVMTGENGAERVKKYSVPMAAGLAYNYGAKSVDDKVLDVLCKLADEAQLAEKYEALYNGEMINTGEKRLVLHQLTRGQLGEEVIADGVNKREFYVNEQKKIADFANKVHTGEITNAAGEKFTTVVQIGIGGSDLGPRAMYLALENWSKLLRFHAKPWNIILFSKYDKSAPSASGVNCSPIIILDGRPPSNFLFRFSSSLPHAKATI